MIENNDHTVVSVLAKWIVDNWVIMTGTVSTFVGGVTYVLHQRFATRAAMERCKTETIDGFITAIKDHERRELAAKDNANSEIKEDIAILHKKVATVDDKVDQLKNLLLQREWMHRKDNT